MNTDFAQSARVVALLAPHPRLRALGARGRARRPRMPVVARHAPCQWAAATRPRSAFIHGDGVNGVQPASALAVYRRPRARENGADEGRRAKNAGRTSVVAARRGRRRGRGGSPARVTLHAPGTLSAESRAAFVPERLPGTVLVMPQLAATRARDVLAPLQILEPLRRRATHHREN
ncbi:hypothetical protein JYU34_017484 [Plutella xylostella]|uniref:Uncharacterized protein n=1 Tax=Plutella xylostella TaxID=51655 RepID=A0ABQ7Q1A9_PLUXY|nr:hypothetical protein JYU34_017484 [Plutella xylostella]